MGLTQQEITMELEQALLWKHTLAEWAEDDALHGNYDDFLFVSDERQIVLENRRLETEQRDWWVKHWYSLRNTE